MLSRAKSCNLLELETAAMQHINDLTVLNTESFTGVMYRMSFVNVTT